MSPQEMADERWIRDNAQRLVAEPNGLTEYQLGLLARVTGSQKVMRLYRERLAAIGPFCRDERGIVQ